jgi:hypothetical protein
MDMSFDRILGIMGVGLAVLGIAIGVGVAIAMDPKSKGELIFSISCLIFSGLVLCLTVGAWGFFSTTSATKRISISCFAFAIICVSMVEASRWANGRYERVEGWVCDARLLLKFVASPALTFENFLQRADDHFRTLD